MNHYIKLVNFEVKRFSKLYLSLIIAVVAAQIIGAIITSLHYVSEAEKTMGREQLTVSDYIQNYSAYSLQNFLYSEYFILSIAFAAAVLMMYVFFIWYRDWLGKSSVIYRLLMLPTARRNVYFAKLTTILLFVFGLLGMQIILLEVLKQVIQLIVPEQLYFDPSVIYIYSAEALQILYPNSPLQFIFYYGIGTALVAIFFTAVLLERSYQLKGIFFALIYIVISVIVIIIPVFIQIITDYFYLNEIVLMTIGSSMIVIALAVYFADRLLNRKINV
ncbi:hypothetical protein MKY51_13740 [Solibacillus sp. FSL R5-0691]|uniref:hypothetical protein n=1 Tax=Solibacillus sp. FSL R5-0691 TaxID=2921653 RepID=UPI0030CBD9AA